MYPIRFSNTRSWRRSCVYPASPARRAPRVASLVLFAAVALRLLRLRRRRAAGRRRASSTTPSRRHAQRRPRDRGRARLKGSPSFGSRCASRPRPVLSNRAGCPPPISSSRWAPRAAARRSPPDCLSTGDRAFVKFQDVYYEQPRAEVARANRSLRERKRERGTLSSSAWIPAAGSPRPRTRARPTWPGWRHAPPLRQPRHGRLLGISTASSAARRRALGGATGQAPPKPLTEAQMRRSRRGGAIRASTSTWARRTASSGACRAGSSSSVQGEPRGARRDRRGTIRFSVEFADVNGDQEVEAPANARPLSALTRSLGVDG